MNTLGRLFRENLGIKLAAVALTLLVYFHVRTEREDELTFRVPVVLKGLPDSLTWTGELPKDVNVTLNGRLKNLIRLRLAPMHIDVDVSQAGPGRFQRTLSSGDVPVPAGSNLLVTHFAGPEHLDILIERKMSKQVRVLPALLGRPPDGFVLTDSATASPESTTVTGPASVVSLTDSLYTEPIDVTTRKASFSQRAKLDVKGKPYTSSASAVQVFVGIEPESLAASADSTASED
jgi:YbbR domain-containing protein